MKQSTDRPGSWRLWHPFQGLWNRELMARLRAIFPRPSYRMLLGAIVLADTAVLFGRALQRRRAKLGIGKLLSRPRVPDDVAIIYFDLGTHREAKELQLMAGQVLPRMGSRFSAYGFEASQSFFEQSLAHFPDARNVTLVHAAVCHDLPPDRRLRLYKRDAERGNASLYRESFGDYEEVDALRFSDWLRDNHIDIDNSICLLRMNIEGAELDVILDLVESGIADKIAGYYGMWDDVGKIDPERGSRFHELLGRYGIDPFTFNDRDLKFSIRRKCIEYDVATSVLDGLARLEQRRVSRATPGRRPHGDPSAR